MSETRAQRIADDLREHMDDNPGRLTLEVSYDWLRELLDEIARLAALSAAPSDTERLRDPIRIGADRLAGAVNRMVQRGALDARSEAADALLDYATTLYSSERPIQRVSERYAEVAAARSVEHTETTQLAKSSDA